MSYSPWGKKETLLVALFVLLFLFTWSRCAHAAPTLQASAGTTIIRAKAPAIDLSFVWDQGGPEAYCGATLVGSSVENNNELPFQMGVHCGMANHWRKLWAGLGVVYLQNTDYTNPAHLNFEPMLQYRFTTQLAVVYRHWSNAGSVQPNRGRDALYLSWMF